MSVSSIWFSRLNLDNPYGKESYVLAFLFSVLVAVISYPLSLHMDIANIIMLFLLEVFLCAIWLGQGPSLLAAIASVLLFDFFFVPPQFALLTTSVEHIVMMVVMLLIALLTGQMASVLLAQNRELQASEALTSSLYRMARELAGASSAQQVEEIARRYPAGAAASSLLSIAHERLHYADMLEAQHVQVESERLRNSILSSLSHDLRTPLTALVGLTEVLQLDNANLSPSQSNMVDAVHEQSVRLAGMVAKLLDLARLSAGKVTINKEWNSLADVTGAALALLSHALAKHPLTVEIPDNFPLVEFDAVLIERVISNLLDNACKYTPAGTPITIAAELNSRQVEMRICDRGSETLFNTLMTSGIAANRVAAPEKNTGLGLAICEAILKVHGGTLYLQQHKGGGICACFTLPFSTPPVMDDEPEEKPA